MALLTAALIVRDEEQHLDACLRSLNNICDELLIVDTGSVDASTEIARAHGARVLELPWPGDFAAARNHGLEHATGRWILQVDADERLQPIPRDALERLLAADDHVAYRIRLRPAIGTTAYLEHRLWRNDPRIRFRGVIHERIQPSINAVAAAQRLRVGVAPLELDHVGYDGDQVAKHRRNLPLLEAKLATEPDSFFEWRHLAEVRRDLGDGAGGIAALRRAIEVARTLDPPDHRAAVAYGDLVHALDERGEDATAVLAEGRSRHPQDWMLVWIEARRAIAAGDAEGALGLLDRLLAVEPDQLAGEVSYDERIFGSLAHEARGLALLRLGRFADAATAYEAAIATGESSTELAAKLAVARARSDSHLDGSSVTRMRRHED